MGAIFKKEMKTYFNTMTGYVFLGFFLLITGFYFTVNCAFSGSSDFISVLSATLIALLILIPVLTMRLFSEETRQKTDQLLFTSPVSIPQIVFGKFFAAIFLFFIGIAITACYAVILSRFGEISFSETFTGVIGYFLMGCCFISVGIFISVLTDNQIIAAVGTFAAMFFIFMIDSIASIMPVTTGANVKFILVLICIVAFFIYNSTKNVYAGVIFLILGCGAVGIAYVVNSLLFDGIITKVLNWFSVLSRYDSFDMGILNITDIIYYITFSFAFLYLTINTIEKRRWR